MEASGRVVLVTVSPRLPPGLLSWPAWQALRAGPVLACGSDDELAALRAAGVQVQPCDGDEVAVLLHDRARRDGLAVWLGPAPGPAGALAACRPAVTVEVVVGSQEPLGAALLDVVALMDRLRSPGGCPWDARQTHRSLAPYLIEETYEAYQAIEDGDPEALREELGDVLLQVVFHARLAQEADPAWSVDNVADDLVAKLVRRHPHVFAVGDSSDPDPAGDLERGDLDRGDLDRAGDLERAWELQKAVEKGRTSVTQGVPLGQPALSLAARLQKRAARLGAPVPAYDGPGGELWELVRQCRDAGLDPEETLRGIARRYRDHLAGVEAGLHRTGRDPAHLTGDQWAQLWAEHPA